MDFEQLDVKQTLNQNNLCSMMVFKETNGRRISYRVPVNVFYDFYLNVDILERMENSIRGFKAELMEMVSKRSDKSYIENRYLEKKDATYEKSKLLTEERLKALFGDYCTEEKVNVDIQECETHSRSVANSIGNYLGIIAGISKSAPSRNSSENSNTSRVIEKMGEMSEGMTETNPQG